MLWAMNFSTKIAIVVRDDLAPWQKLNVACFLSGGLVGSYPELAGERYRRRGARKPYWLPLLWKLAGYSLAADPSAIY